MTPQDKYTVLKENLARRGKLAIAFSGGVDSALLLRAAVDALGRGNVLAVTARAINFPEREERDADGFARELGVGRLRLDLDVMTVPGFAENSADRCYHCKKAIFSALIDAARANGFSVIADGANVDDLSDYRPGSRAARELGVVSPLSEAGLTKADIRELLRDLGSRFSEKPSFACLASRIPYGQRILAADLERIGDAEDYFLKAGFRNVRVRIHGDLARIEVDPDERARFFDEGFLDAAATALKAMGFAYSALDLLGYRTGSMNETLSGTEK